MNISDLQRLRLIFLHLQFLLISEVTRIQKERSYQKMGSDNDSEHNERLSRSYTKRSGRRKRRRRQSSSSEGETSASERNRKSRTRNRSEYRQKKRGYQRTSNSDNGNSKEAEDRSRTRRRRWRREDCTQESLHTGELVIQASVVQSHFIYILNNIFLPCGDDLTRG